MEFFEVGLFAVLFSTTGTFITMKINKDRMANGQKPLYALTDQQIKLSKDKNYTYKGASTSVNPDYETIPTKYVL